jgi:hypothetical protein
MGEEEKRTRKRDVLRQGERQRQRERERQYFEYFAMPTN